jgi:hypothetical protein
MSGLATSDDVLRVLVVNNRNPHNTSDKRHQDVMAFWWLRVLRTSTDIPSRCKICTPHNYYGRLGGASHLKELQIARFVCCGFGETGA